MGKNEPAVLDSVQVVKGQSFLEHFSMLDENLNMFVFLYLSLKH